MRLRNSFPGKVNHLLSDPPGDNVGGALPARGVGRKWLRAASAPRTRAGGQDRAARGLCLPHPCVHTPRHTHVHGHTHTRKDTQTYAHARTHTHTCKDTHPDIRAHTHMQRHTPTHTHMHGHTHRCKDTHLDMHTHTCKDTHTYVHAHTHTCKDTHPDIHTCRHTHARAHKHTHTQSGPWLSKANLKQLLEWSVCGNNGLHPSLGDKAFFSGVPGTPGLVLSPDWLGFGNSLRSRLLDVVPSHGPDKGEDRGGTSS